MKKLTICAVAVSGLFAAQANAGDVQVVGFVPAVCAVTGLNTQLLDVGSVVAIGSTISQSLTIQCNDADGATVSLTSAEGGLESDDKEDYSIGYDATLTPGTLAPFTLNVPGGYNTNNTTASQSYGGTVNATALAGSVSATLDIVTTGASLWSGGYSDTLTIQISAN